MHCFLVFFWDVRRCTWTVYSRFGFLQTPYFALNVDVMPVIDFDWSNGQSGARARNLYLQHDHFYTWCLN